MKQIFVFLLGASLLACNAGDKKTTTETAGEPQVAPSSVSDPASLTTIQWLDSTNQNLGNLTKGQVVEISWRFKNAGDKPLVVQNFQGTCGCTAAEKPSEPVAPGGEGVLKATYTSSGDMGHVSKQVTLYANLKNHNNGNDTKLGFTAEVAE